MSFLARLFGGRSNSGQASSQSGRDGIDDVFSYISNQDTRRLVTALMREESDGSRARELSVTLVKLGADTVRPLKDVLGYGNALARLNAARALGELVDTDAVAVLESALSDREWTVRCQAALALGKIGDPSALESLKQQLANEDDGFTAPIHRIGDRIVDNMHDHVKAKCRMAIEAIGRGEKIPPNVQ